MVGGGTATGDRLLMLSAEPGGDRLLMLDDVLAKRCVDSWTSSIAPRTIRDGRGGEASVSSALPASAARASFLRCCLIAKTDTTTSMACEVHGWWHVCVRVRRGALRHEEASREAGAAKEAHARAQQEGARWSPQAAPAEAW